MDISLLFVLEFSLIFEDILVAATAIMLITN